LESYDWPGNIGELESAIDAAVRAGKDEPTLDLKHFTEIADRLHAKHLGCEFEVDEHPNGCKSHEIVNGIESVESQPLIANNAPWMTLAEAESFHIRRTLELAEFNTTVAATMLGLSINAFRRKLKRHCLQHFLSSEFDKT
jgi:DNA-binding NtrC family response regulator